MSNYQELSTMANNIKKQKKEFKESEDNMERISNDFTKKYPTWKKISDNPSPDEIKLVKEIYSFKKKHEKISENIEIYSSLKEEYVKEQVPCRFLRCCLLKFSKD